MVLPRQGQVHAVEAEKHRRDSDENRGECQYLDSSIQCVAIDERVGAADRIQRLEVCLTRLDRLVVIQYHGVDKLAVSCEGRKYMVFSEVLECRIGWSERAEEVIHIIFDVDEPDE